MEEEIQIKGKPILLVKQYQKQKKHLIEKPKVPEQEIRSFKQPPPPKIEIEPIFEPFEYMGYIAGAGALIAGITVLFYTNKNK